MKKYIIIIAILNINLISLKLEACPFIPTVAKITFSVLETNVKGTSKILTLSKTCHYLRKLVKRGFCTETNETRKIKLAVTGDAFPGELIDPDVITLNGKDVRKNLFKPRKYKLIIKHAGYKTITKNIVIRKKQGPFLVKEILCAKKRNLSFNLPDVYCGCITPHKVINANNGKSITYKNYFKPVTKLSVLVKFQSYKTIEKTAIIVPGEGPFVIDIPLQKLKCYEFTSRFILLELDGIKYPYTFYVDGKLIEDQHFSIEKAIGYWYYTVRVLSNAKYLRIQGGYMFSEKAFNTFNNPIGISHLSYIGDLQQVSITKLIDHLKQLSKADKGKQLVALETMERMMKSSKTRKMLKEKGTKLTLLINFIQSWKLPIKQHKKRSQTLITAISILKR